MDLQPLSCLLKETSSGHAGLEVFPGSEWELSRSCLKLLWERDTSARQETEETGDKSETECYLGTVTAFSDRD